MSSFHAMNSPPKSSAMRGLYAQNTRTMNSLDKELSRLDAERKIKMKELNQATRHFVDLKLRPLSARSRETSPDRCSSVSLPAYARDRSMSRSPSPRPRTPLDDMFPLTSLKNHKVIYRKSLSTDESPTSPTHLSNNSSPESPRKLLSKRNEDDLNKLKKCQNIPATSITQVSYSHLSLPSDRTGNSNPTSPRNKTTKSNSSSVGLPKIIVSDTSPKPPDVVPCQGGKRPVSPLKKHPRESPRQNECTSSGSNDDVLSGALQVPIRRSRSNSVPTISSSIQHLLVVSKNKPTKTNDDNGVHIEPEVKFRTRSSSICVPYFVHLKDAPRRNSLLRKYIARPKIFHRTARTIDQLISDLAKGISCQELIDDKYRSKPISPEEWESLRKCRYLRMPSKNEDVTGNTLDIEAIFSD